MCLNGHKGSPAYNPNMTWICCMGLGHDSWDGSRLEGFYWHCWRGPITYSTTWRKVQIVFRCLGPCYQRCGDSVRAPKYLTCSVSRKHCFVPWTTQKQGSSPQWIREIWGFDEDDFLRRKIWQTIPISFYSHYNVLFIFLYCIHHLVQHFVIFLQST